MAMGFLRDRLKVEAPALFAAFERSWETAQAEWLPAIAASEGSYNSYPHFRNVENHLDELAAATAGASLHAAIRLTPLEIYLLLASVLFHDFGRVHGDEDHAYASAENLRRHWSHLGIPSAVVAGSLARIAIYHDPVRKKASDGDPRSQVERARSSLCEITIEPYGLARELSIATLLALADHLDGSVRRTLPDYVQGAATTGFKGAFRRLVSGATYDTATQCIKTSLIPVEHYHTPDTLEKEANDAFVSVEGKSQCHDPKWRDCPLFPSYFGFGRTSRFTSAREGRVFLKRTAREGEWPADYVLGIVLLDLENNRRFLGQIKRDLYEMGLPVANWFVTHRNECYDSWGNWQVEETLSLEFFERLVGSMWTLSRLVLRSGAFSYETLADAMRESQIELVQRAVRRVAAWVPGAIACGSSNWFWLGGNAKDYADVIQRVRDRYLESKDHCPPP